MNSSPRVPFTIQTSRPVTAYEKEPAIYKTSTIRHLGVTHPHERILRNICQWKTEVFLEGFGSKGTRKPAIALTVAEWCKEDGLLAAAFFFFHGIFPKPG